MKEPENGNYPSQAGEGTIAIRPGMDGIYNAGGFNSYATSVFARGTGPLEESRVPYQNNEGVLNEGVKVTAKDGTEYLAQDYVSTKMETREIEYECLIPSTMTKEEVLEIFEFYPDLKEKLIKRLEEGVITKVESVARYVDDNGKYYSVVHKNELGGLDGFPEILIYEDEDGVRYEFDPATKTFPGLPELHIIGRTAMKSCFIWRRMCGAGDAFTQLSFLNQKHRRSGTGFCLKARTIMYLTSTPRIHACRSPGRRAGWMEICRPRNMKQ